VELTKEIFEKLYDTERVMASDFADCEYDPNFDCGIDGFATYLWDLHQIDWYSFTTEQRDEIISVVLV